MRKGQRPVSAPHALLLFFLVTTALFAVSCASRQNRPVTDVKRNARGFEELALDHYARGDVQGALHFFQKALSEDQKVNNLPGISSDLYNIARCYVNLGLDDNAEKVLAEAGQINTYAGNRIGQGDVYLLLAQIRMRRNDYDGAGSLIEQGLALHKREKNDKGIANAYNNMGTLALKTARYEQAYEYLDKAISIHKKIKNRQGLAIAYNNMGYLSELQGKEQEAVRYYLLALEVDTFLENSIGISSDLHNIARLYKTTGDYEQALFYYKRALDTNRSLSLADRVEQDLESIIDLLGTMGRREERAIYEKALAELG